MVKAIPPPHEFAIETIAYHLSVDPGRVGKILMAVMISSGLDYWTGHRSTQIYATRKARSMLKMSFARRSRAAGFQMHALVFFQKVHS